MTERVPVLIVGGGYAGLTAALFLSHHNVPCLLVDRHSGASIQGRARGINPRTIELYRPIGIDAAIYEAGKPFEHDFGGVRCETLTSEWHWLFGDPSEGTNQEAVFPGLENVSPATFCLADQSAVEPVLIDSARKRGADLRFNTQLTSFNADADGVTAEIEDRKSGTRTHIRADYLIAADGQRSPIRDQLGITRTAAGDSRSFMSIVFRADLSGVIPHRAILWFIINEAVAGVLATSAEPDRWGFGVGYDPNTETVADFTPERCTELIRAAIGRADLPVEIEDVTPWTQAVAVANEYRSGRVFLAGDSAHVWSPAGGIGANTGVQDSHNLAWKLAAVVHGWAGPELLDSYEPERRPIAEVLAKLTEERQAHRTGSTPEQDKIEDMLWIFGQRYSSGAIVDPEQDTVFAEQLDLRAQPGTRAPHLWVTQDGTRRSTHDLFDRAFVLLTEPGGRAWCEAAWAVADRLSVPLRTYRVGAGDKVDLVDVDGVWPDRYDIAADGAVLVRPDGYVAWRSRTLGDDPAAELANVLERLLARKPATLGR